MVSLVIGGHEYWLRGEDYILDTDPFRIVEDGKQMCRSGFFYGIKLSESIQPINLDLDPNFIA